MERNDSILGGALLLTAANLLLRLISIAFQVFLSVRIGAAGLGLFGLVAALESEEGVTLNWYMPGSVQAVTPQGQPLTLFLDTQYPQVPQAIKEEQVISDETEKTLVTAIEEFKKRFH